MPEVRRGRKRQSEYRELVVKAFRVIEDRSALETFPVLSQLPAIEQWATAHPRELLPHGKALQRLLLQAVAEVLAGLGEDDDAWLARFKDLLRQHYQQRVAVHTLAKQWGCSRVQVWRSYGQRALDMVTERFLELARSTEPEAEKVTVLPGSDQVPNAQRIRPEFRRASGE